MADYDKKLIGKAKGEVSDYFKPSETQDKAVKAISGAWDSVKGLVGGGDDDAMGKALKQRAKRLKD